MNVSCLPMLRSGVSLLSCHQIQNENSIGLDLDGDPAEQEEDGDPRRRRDVAEIDGRPGHVPAPGHDVPHGLASSRARQVPGDGLQVAGHPLHGPQDS